MQLVDKRYIESDTFSGYTPRSYRCDGCGSPIDGSDAHFEIYICHDESYPEHTTCHHVCADRDSDCINNLFTSLED